MMVRFGAEENVARGEVTQAMAPPARPPARPRSRSDWSRPPTARACSTSTTASTAPGAASGSHSTGSASPWSTAIARQGHLLRALRRPRHRQGRAQLVVEAPVLEGLHDRQARAVPGGRCRRRDQAARWRCAVPTADRIAAPTARRSSRSSVRSSSAEAAAAMRFCSLGSGSEGNGLVVEAGDTRVLIDCGFGLRDTAFRLARAGLEPQGLTAILVTHEHSDHVGGVAAFAGRHGIAVWGSFGTLAAVAARFEGLADVSGFDSHAPFAIGDLEITPVPVPHDAREPTQFVLGDGDSRLGVLTDIGVSTPHVEASLSGCDALVLETNHCLDLLAGSDYPYPLKQRIAGRLGHLDNGSSAALLAPHRHHASEAHRRGAPLAAEQHARPGARGARRGARLHGRLDWRRESGRGVRLARHLTENHDGKAAGTLQGQGQDRLRDRRPASAGDALSRRRLGVRRREARQARPQGRDQQPDQRLRDGQARGRRRADALRRAAERARVAGQGDEDGAGRVRRPQRLRRIDGQALRHCRGHAARRADLRVLPQERRAARPAGATRTTSACWAGRRRARSTR